MTKQKHQGGCQCSAVRFEAAGAPKFISNCHCRACRKATGGAFSTWIGFGSENLRWLSAPAFFASSPGVKRGYCQACGTPLSYQGEKWAGETHILIGVFDDDHTFIPTNEAFVDEALTWTRDGPRHAE